MTAIRAVTPADPVRPAAKPAALRALARLRTPGANLSDREFLAPALEILETPPSPVHVAFLWTICAFVLAALVWAYLGHVDIVAAAQGKFQPTGRVKVVEPLETGRVEDIRVANGSLVKAGDVLIELDRASAEADVEGARAELSSARAEILRRKAALVAAQAHTFDSPPKIDWPDGVAPGLREREEQVLAADLGQLAATQASFAAERAQKTAERDKLGETIATQRNLVATLKERVDMRTKLVEEKAGAKAAVIDATETLQYQITQQAKQEQELASLSAGLEVISRDADKAVQAFVSDDAEKLDDAERRVEDVEQRFVKAQAELDRLTLRAPIAGRVQSSVITNVGQVVASGQEVMRIVPEDSGLEIEAYVRNRDIGFVSVGQEAVVKVESFPYTRYGAIYAHVVRIAKDAIPEPDAQAIEGDPARVSAAAGFAGGERTQNLVFPVVLKPDAATITVDGVAEPLTSGMAVTVELKTGSSTDARIPLRPAGRSRLRGDARTVRRALLAIEKGKWAVSLRLRGEDGDLIQSPGAFDSLKCKIEMDLKRARVVKTRDTEHPFVVDHRWTLQPWLIEHERRHVEAPLAQAREYFRKMLRSSSVSGSRASRDHAARCSSGSHWLGSAPRSSRPTKWRDRFHSGPEAASALDRLLTAAPLPREEQARPAARWRAAV